MRVLHRGWARVGVMATVAAAVAVGVVVFGVDGGHPAHNLRLLSGSAWLSSARVGQVTLLDGTSAEVSAQVQVVPAGSALEVVQQGSTAYAVDRTAGTVRRVDGATFELTQPESPIPDARAGLTAIPGPDALYTLDTQRGVLAQTDPRTLTRRGELITLASQLSDGTAAVDEAGRLWTIDTETGDVIRIAGGRRSVQRQVVQPGRSLLTLAGGAPVVVDTVGRKAITLDPSSGRTSATMELDLRPNDEIEISGSPHAARLYVVASRGTLAVCELIASSCDTVVPLGAGSKLGAAVEVGNRVFVPDYTTGQVWIVDLAQPRVVARPRVLTPAGPFQLLTRDGIVFYNDPNTERAGVIHLDGSVVPAAKYDPKDPGKGMHSPETTPSQPPLPPPNPPSNPNTPPPAPNNPPPPPSDPPQNPTNPQPPPNGPPQQPVRPHIAMSNTGPIVNEQITLQVTNPGGPAPTAAHWTFGDGAEGDGPTTQHRWATPKTYQVSVRATLPDGRSATASASVTVKAKPTVTLTVNVPGGGGAITGGGINCPGVCTAEFDPDLHTTVTLTATEDADHLLGTWSGACSGAETTCDVTMDASKTVGYQFRTKDPTITYTITPAAGGTISVDTATCPNTCSYQANRGQNVDFRATPDATHEFDTWINGCSNAAVPSCTTHSETDRTVSARFKPKKFTLTVTFEPERPGYGSGRVTGQGVNCTADCSVDFDPGTSVTLTATADADSYFPGYWSNNCPNTADDTCTVTMNADTTVHVTFGQA